MISIEYDPSSPVRTYIMVVLSLLLIAVPSVSSLSPNIMLYEHRPYRYRQREVEIVLNIIELGPMARFIILRSFDIGEHA